VSALALQNVCKAIGTDLQITKLKVPGDRTEFTNVELSVGKTLYYGELTISTFLAKSMGASTFLTQASGDLTFD
jgi:hypothetical protein